MRRSRPHSSACLAAKLQEFHGPQLRGRSGCQLQIRGVRGVVFEGHFFSSRHAEKSLCMVEAPSLMVCACVHMQLFLHIELVIRILHLHMHMCVYIYICIHTHMPICVHATPFYFLKAAGPRQSPTGGIGTQGSHLDQLAAARSADCPVYQSPRMACNHQGAQPRA